MDTPFSVDRVGIDEVEVSPAVALLGRNGDQTSEEGPLDLGRRDGEDFGPSAGEAGVQKVAPIRGQSVAVLDVLEVDEPDLIEVVHGSHQRPRRLVAGDEIFAGQALKAESRANRYEADTRPEIAATGVGNRVEDLARPRDVTHPPVALLWRLDLAWNADRFRPYQPSLTG